MRSRKGKSVLLLSPSRGFGGGIERVGDALMEACPGAVARVDLYKAGRERRAAGDLLAKLRFTARTVRVAAVERPKQIACLHIGLLPAAHLAAIMTRAPVILVAHGTEVWAPMARFQRRLVRRCSRLIAFSDFTAEWLTRRAGVARAHATIVPLGIAPRLAQEAAGYVAGPSQEGIVVTVGRIMRDHRYKGHHSIAAAWPRVLEERPDARWVIIGDGDDVGALKERCHRLKIDHAVTFRPRVSDVDLAATYRTATALVLPSKADVHARPPTGEGFGLVYAEAAAFGVPSVAAEMSGGAAEIVENLKTGLTVNPDDSRELANAILVLLNDDDLCRRLGAEARRKVLARHLPEHFAARLRELAFC